MGGPRPSNVRLPYPEAAVVLYGERSRSGRKVGGQRKRYIDVTT